MFAQNEILVFTPGRKQEGLDRLAWIHGLMAPHAGFKEAFVAKYLGDGTRYTIMRFWEDEAAYQAFRESADGNFGRSRPEGLYANEPVITPLTVYGEHIGSASGHFLVKLQADVAPEAWPALLAHQKVMLENADAVPGIVWDRQMRGRDKDEDRDALIGAARFSSREAFENLLESPRYLELVKGMPQGVTLARVECFEVISDVGPQS